jgi:hypothetical protein
MYLSFYPKGSFAGLGFFGEQVATIRLPEGDLSCPGDLEGLFCTGVCFNLGHKMLFSVYPAGVPEQTGLLWNRLGQYV